MRFTSFAELLPLSGSFMQVLKISKLVLLVYLILPAALDLGFTQPLTEMSTKDRNKSVSEE
jgi:hypothetical protein